MRYFLLNLGCQMNQTDAERIQTVLEQMGLVRTEVEAEAQVLGLVACSVRQKAIDRVYSKIHQWNERKARENLITFVSGCILPADKEKFLDRFDLVFAVSEVATLPDQLRQYGVVTPLTAGTTADLQSFWQITPHYSSSFEAFIPIQNGCDKFCTFCAVPYTRGREVSRPSADILAEVFRLVDAGYKSLTLLGQNVNSYGLDQPGQELTFAQLLAAIGQRAEDRGDRFWLYFTSPHPRDMTREVFQTMARYPVLAQQIHLPLQSGDDKVLIRMNRNHTMDRYRQLMTALREILPEATVFTDIIVGFTGETEPQFENTRQAMLEFQYQMAYIAPYSPRPGAASARWDDDVPLETKKQRLQILTDVLHQTGRAYTERQIGRTVTVLVERPDKKPGYLSGRTEGRILVRFAAPEAGLIGHFVQVRIESVAALSMEGVLEQDSALTKTSGKLGKIGLH